MFLCMTVDVGLTITTSSLICMEKTGIHSFLVKLEMISGIIISNSYSTTIKAHRGEIQKMSLFTNITENASLHPM